MRLTEEVAQAMTTAGNNLLKAAESRDPQLMLAVLINTCEHLPDYKNVMLNNRDRVKK